RLNIDTLARYGGEEFVLILPETGLDGARIVAEKIRQEVAATPFGTDEDEPIEVTVSIGYASYPEHGLTQQALDDAADKAMYEAKARGRNRVVGAEAPTHGSLRPFSRARAHARRQGKHRPSGSHARDQRHGRHPLHPPEGTERPRARGSRCRAACGRRAVRGLARRQHHGGPASR